MTRTSVEELPQPGFKPTQNYPNPFSEFTTITFELDKPQRVHLRVFDVTCREVAQLVDASLAAGAHSANFRPDGLTNGLYVYRLEADGVVTVGSMVLAR